MFFLFCVLLFILKPFATQILWNKMTWTITLAMVIYSLWNRGRMIRCWFDLSQDIWRNTLLWLFSFSYLSFYLVWFLWYNCGLIHNAIPPPLCLLSCLLLYPAKPSSFYCHCDPPNFAFACNLLTIRWGLSANHICVSFLHCVSCSSFLWGLLPLRFPSHDECTRVKVERLYINFCILWLYNKTSFPCITFASFP